MRFPHLFDIFSEPTGCEMYTFYWCQELMFDVAHLAHLANEVKVQA